MTVGFIGLGKMGSRMVQKLIADKHEVLAWNRTFENSLELKKDNPKLKIARTIEELMSSLKSPKIVWLMVSANAVDDVLRQVSKYLKKQDIVIDGGNSNYLDTEKRFKEFEKKHIKFLGIGTSGGILAIKNGYPFMVGGNQSAYKQIIPILDTLSKPNGGHEYFGKGGAGHFVKMVHNGIEYGIMQSLGEGFEVLEKSNYKFNLVKVASLWQKGTLVSGFLLDRAKDALVKNPKLNDILGVIDASGEALWTLAAAKKEKVSVEIIEKSLDYRTRSKTDKKIQASFTARMVAALRREFGGHAVKRK
jgi:6-phosphogluconate dehydrogenase